MAKVVRDGRTVERKAQHGAIGSAVETGRHQVAGGRHRHAGAGGGQNGNGERTHFRLPAQDVADARDAAVRRHPHVVERVDGHRGNGAELARRNSAGAAAKRRDANGRGSDGNHVAAHDRGAVRRVDAGVQREARERRRRQTGVVLVGKRKLACSAVIRVRNARQAQRWPTYSA